MILLPNLEPGSDEWLDRRRLSLGASDIPAALGFSTWTSAYEVWAEKTGRIERPPPTASMRLGTRLEPFILDEWESEHGMYAGLRGRTFQSGAYPWLTASPDAIAFEHPDAGAEDLGGALGVVEAKTDFNLWDEVPEHYQIQVQVQLAVTGLDHAWVYLMAVGARKFAVYELERDNRLITSIVGSAAAFWGYVAGDTEPPVDDSPHTAGALADIYPTHTPGLSVELDDDLVAAAAELDRVKEQQATLKERRTYLENRLKAELDDAEVGTIGGRKAVSWKTQKLTKPDIKRLKLEWPDVYKEITPTDRTIRVFRTHDATKEK